MSQDNFALSSLVDPQLLTLLRSWSAEVLGGVCCSQVSLLQEVALEKEQVHCGCWPSAASTFASQWHIDIGICHCLGTGILLAHGLGQVKRSLDFADLSYVFLALC